MATPDQLLKMARGGSTSAAGATGGLPKRSPSYSPEAKLARQKRRAETETQAKPAVRSGPGDMTKPAVRIPTDPIRPTFKPGENMSPGNAGGAPPIMAFPPSVGKGPAQIGGPPSDAALASKMSSLNGGGLMSGPADPGFAQKMNPGVVAKPAFPGFKPMGPDSPISGGGFAGGGPNPPADAQAMSMGRFLPGAPNAHPDLSPPLGADMGGKLPGGPPGLGRPGSDLPPAGMGMHLPTEPPTDMPPPPPAGAEPGMSKPMAGFHAFGQIGAGGGGVNRRPGAAIQKPPMSF